MAAEAAVSFAVETLGKLLIEKAVFLIGVKEEVEWLRHELESMLCFLKDAAKKQSESESIRKWISDIREVAHDAEDAIEIFILKVQSKSLMERYGCFPNHLYHLNNVGNKIASIRQTLKDIQDRRVTYAIQKDSDDEKVEPITRTKKQKEVETRRRVAYWKPDQHVVGLEEDVKLLLREAVFKESQGLSVAAILGMGGLGKSTLASEIYNHPEVKVAGRFDFRSWVVVSSEFTEEDIMKQILLQLGISVKHLGSIDDKVARQEELKKKLHESLTGKRYFIVLDDVWEAAHWESFTTAFPDEDKGSRLLLTSRNPIITMNSGYVHNMKPLDANESWELFIRKTFSGNNRVNGCPEELKKVGEEILKKCGGLPLAISVVGGLLAKKTPSKSEWEKVYKEMKSRLDRSTGDLSTIIAILELSYENLSLELKSCFMCMGFFKEDAIVKVTNLVHIWVAQGLVPLEVEGDGVRMEDVGRDYLNELISRNMVQVKEKEYDRVKGCQMHDLLRDLSIRKAKEEIDFEVLREGGDSHQYSLAKPRHRAIYYNEPDTIFSTSRNRHLRSLFVHHEDWRHTSGGPSSYWKSFELLRVLDLSWAYFWVYPKGIAELTGLRYLRMICREEVSRLPRTWAKLKNLEVLDLRGSYGVIKIDKVIVKMKSLRHLYAHLSSSKVGLGNMKNLQTLHLFRVETSSHVWKIQGMSGVSKLGIDMSQVTETSGLYTCLSSLENIFHLTLSGFTPSTALEKLTFVHPIFPRVKLRRSLPVNFPPNLTHLTLSMMWLEEDSMPVLEKLPKLLYLKLDCVDKSDRIMVITSGGFPSLKVLHIKNMEYGCKMESEESAMPELNQFIIRYCLNLDVENLPERIKSAIVKPH